MADADRLASEFAFIDWVRRRASINDRVVVGIGDDAASLRLTPGCQALITTDMILEGIHFDLSGTTPYWVGRKAMGVNLSDIAAMAGLPVSAVASVALPRGFARAAAEELFRGMHELACEFDVALAGGDTNASKSGLIVCITLLGESRGSGPVLRSGARTGDWILVTGSLGGSSRGKHLEFTPRVREAQSLADRCRLNAMIDISDGLAADLGHVLEESRCGGLLDPARIPISEAARQIGDAFSPLDHALYDGEDFELLFTAAPDDAARLVAEQPLNVPLTHIGDIVAEPGLWLVNENGERQAIEPRGFDHFRSP